MSESIVQPEKVQGQPEPVIEEFTRVIRSRLASDTAPINEANWDQEVLRQVENDLLEYVGPLAKVVVRKEAERALSLEDLHVRIAKSIPAGAKRKAYMERVARESGESATLSRQKTVKINNDTQTSSVRSKSAAPTNSQMAWDPIVLSGAEKILAAFVGPLAAMLVRKASRRTQSERELYVLLANEIDDPNDRDQFIRSIPQR